MAPWKQEARKAEENIRPRVIWGQENTWGSCLVSFLTIQTAAFTVRSSLLSSSVLGAGIKVAWGENSFLAAKYILEKKQIANGSYLSSVRM